MGSVWIGSREYVEVDKVYLDGSLLKLESDGIVINSINLKLSEWSIGSDRFSTRVRVYTEYGSRVDIEELVLRCCSFLSGVVSFLESSKNAYVWGNVGSCCSSHYLLSFKKLQTLMGGLRNKTIEKDSNSYRRKKVKLEGSFKYVYINPVGRSEVFLSGKFSKVSSECDCCVYGNLDRVISDVVITHRECREVLDETEKKKVVE